MTKLFLDDVRTPPDTTWHVVRNYDAFVKWMERNPTPEVISFDHDLAFEHYPFADPNPTQEFRYGQYKEKTGYEAAKWCVDNDRLPATAIVHSLNPVGAQNILNLLKGKVDVLVRKPMLMI
jgi:hypothetical protein